jgi:ferredoxin
MGLSRIVLASAGLCELHTCGCKTCRVWVTEAKERWAEAKEPWYDPRDPAAASVSAKR